MTVSRWQGRESGARWDFRIRQGSGFQDFIFHSKEIGFHCEGSGETIKYFDQGSNQGRFAF